MKCRVFVHNVFWLGILAIISCIAVPHFTLQAQAEDVKRNPVLTSLPANSWVYLNPKPYKRQTATKRDENAPLKEETVQEPPFREYTSPIYGEGKIYYFGGGHSGYPGNDVEIFDPIANTWKQCYPPRCPAKGDSTYYSGGSQNAYVDPDTGACQPYVLHGYARTNFDSNLHRYICTATFPTKVEQDATTKKWKLVTKGFGLISFDAKSNIWEWLGPAPDLGPFGLSEYNPDLGGILGIAGREVRVFKKGSWTTAATSNIDLSRSGGAAIANIPDQKLHVVAMLGHGGKTEVGQLALLNVAEKKSRLIESVPEDLRARIAAGTGGYNLVMAYDTAHKKLIVMSVNEDLTPDVWLFDISTDRWTKLPATPTAPKLKSRFEPGVGRAPLLYDPVHGVFFLITRKNDSIQTWAYRALANR